MWPTFFPGGVGRKLQTLVLKAINGCRLQNQIDRVKRTEAGVNSVLVEDACGSQTKTLFAIFCLQKLPKIMLELYL